MNLIKNLFKLFDNALDKRVSHILDRLFFYLNYFYVSFKLFKAIKLKKNIIIEFNNATNSNTYGEFFESAMFIRYLSCHTSNIKFRVIQNLTNANSKIFQDSEILQFHDFQRDCVSLVVSNNIEVEFLLDKDTNILDKKNYIQINFCYLLPGILNLLIKYFKIKICNNFLLNNQASENPLNYSYIAWHIRKNNSYDIHRNATKKQIIEDYRSLRKLFPSQKIILFSSMAGLNSTYSILEDGLESSEASDLPTHLIKQPARTYLECIDFVINSKFYFQRAGGGLGIFAIYSQTPYLMLCQNDHYYFSSKKKIVPWSNENQVYFDIKFKNVKAYTHPIEFYHKRKN